MGAFIEHAQEEERMIVFMAPSEFDEYLKVEEQKKEDQRKKEKKEKFAPSPTIITEAAPIPMNNSSLDEKSNDIISPNQDTNKEEKTET